MTTLAEFMIISDADNRPSMLEKSLYDSWKSRIKLYIENQKNGRMILNALQNGPLVWPTIVEEDGTTRTKKYEELSVTKKLQADYDLKATNILLQGSLQPTINLKLPLIQETKPLFKTAGLLCHMARQCTQPKRTRNSAWFKEKAMLAEVQEARQILDEEKLTFLADPGILDGQAAQTTISNTDGFQTEDLDCNTPKIRYVAEYTFGVLLHNTCTRVPINVQKIRL
ncbi:hypothetical protein Tco_0597102 [Tanacetum coccineum]